MAQFYAYMRAHAGASNEKHYPVGFNIFVQIPSPSSVLFGGCGCCCYVFVCLVWKESSGDCDNLGFCLYIFTAEILNLGFSLRLFTGEIVIYNLIPHLFSHTRVKIKKSDILFTVYPIFTIYSGTSQLVLQDQLTLLTTNMLYIRV